MGSIYGNRERKENNLNKNGVNHNHNVNRKERYNNTNKERRSYKDHKRNIPSNGVSKYDFLNNVKLRRFVNSSVISLIITVIFIIISVIMVSSEYRDVYIKLLILPIASFVCGFIMKFLNKDALMNIAGIMAIQFISFLIFVDFSFFVFLWLLFYLVNAIIGTLIATIAKNFKE